MCVPQLPGWSSKINVLNRWMLQRRIWIIIRNQDKHATSLLQFRMEVTDLDRSLVQTIRFHHTDSYRVLDLRWYNCHRLDRVTGHTGSNLCWKSVVVNRLNSDSKLLILILNRSIIVIVHTITVFNVLFSDPLLLYTQVSYIYTSK